MAFDSVEEVLSFVEVNKLMFEGKTGFRHYAEKLDDLHTFIKTLAEENERLKAEAQQSI